MKNSFKSTSQILAAGAAGGAFFQLANSSFIAALPGDVLAAVAFSAAIIGLAAADYARRIQPLAPPARLLRPALTQTRTRSSAYGVNASVRTDHHDRIAA